MRMHEIISQKYLLTDISMVARDILDHFHNHKIFALSGELGTGKTTLIQSLCEHLNVTDKVTSPTFTIVSVYHSKDHDMINHIDCYRLKNVEEAISIGMDDYLYNNQYCFIEWPKVIEALLPDDYVAVEIEALENGLRSLTAKEICKNNTSQK